jgi:uncharacterized membrane protein YphA (DoxX/SURF4 family)
MSKDDPTSSAERKWVYIGWVIGILPSIALVLSGIMKFVKPVGMDDGMAHLGWDMSKATSLGILEISCVVVYLFPKTAILGAILCTGYMGGAIATHVRVDDPFVIQVLVGVLFWLGLWLREPRLRELIPLRK